MSVPHRFPAPAPLARGGRVTLRLGMHDDERVRYEGVASTTAGEWPLRIDASRKNGSVTAEHAGAPAWLVELGSALVRGVLRAERAGTPFPRRLQRWRSGPGDAC